MLHLLRVSLFFLFFLISFLQSSKAQTDTSQKVVPNRKNSLAQQKKPYVILISADGFRHDFDKKYGANFLLSMRKHGVHAVSMIPSFPSSTFPNHYTLVTGMYPSHHGLIDNSFYDPQREKSYSSSDKKAVKDGSWYGGTPLWVLAEQQQMLSASFYWVGSEAAIKNTRPTYWYPYNEKIDIDSRIAATVNWLKLPESERPHLITFYLPEVDHEAHRHGPDAPETRDAVLFVDSAVRKLPEDVKKTGLPVNFIFVSDHGMTKANNEHPLLISDIPADTTQYTISGSGTMLDVFVKNKEDIHAVYTKLKKNEKGYKVYTKFNTPSHWHYSAKDDSAGRIADVLLAADWPGYFSNRQFNPGQHGYDPYEVKEMHATFIAWGPAFRSNMQIPAFENVHVYPLVAEILGLNLQETIDGRLKVLKSVLKKEPR